VVVQQLVGGDIDLGIIGAPVKHETITLSEFIRDELIIIGPATDGNRDLELTPGELVASKLILREPDSGTRMMFCKTLENNGFDTQRLRVVMELGSTRAIITAVESGLGLSVVSRLSALDALQLGKVSEVKVSGMGTLERSLYLAWNHNRYISYSARAMLAYLEKHKDRMNKLIWSRK
jgi:DNA-binding transcriptional LysR family regulator